MPWIRSLERKLQWRKRKRERERERREHKIGGKEGEKLNFDVCLTRLSFIKVTTSVTHASIYSLVSHKIGGKFEFLFKFYLNLWSQILEPKFH